MDKKEMVLIQGTVKFEVDISVLVDPDTANNEFRLDDLLVDKAFKCIDGSSDEVEVINEVDVLISPDTTEKHLYKVISDDDWKNIVAESKKLKSL